MELKELIEHINTRELKLSFSSLKQFAKSPEHFIRYKLREFKPSPAMKFGSLVHCVILEPDKVPERYVSGITIPTTDLQESFADHLIERAMESDEKKVQEGEIENIFAMYYKKGTAFDLYNSLRGYIEARIEGMEVVSKADMEEATRLKERALGNKVSGKLLESITQTERPLEWVSHNGWAMRGYSDADNDELLLDLKVTDADPAKIDRFIFNGDYYVQMAMYLDAFRQAGKPKKDVKVLAIDRDGNISVNRIEEDYLYYGEHKYRKWCQDFEKAFIMRKWKANYEFYGIHKGEFLVRKPTWAPEIMEVYNEQ